MNQNKTMNQIFLAGGHSEDRPLSFIVEELRKIEEIVSPLEENKKLGLISQRVANINDVFKIVSENSSICIFHFAGHADDQNLFLEKDGNIQGIAELFGLTKKESNSLNLVFLNGCATVGQVAKLHLAGIPLVIASSRNIQDHSAAIFATTFYGIWAMKGKSLIQAFNTAKARVYTENDLEIVQANFRDKVDEQNFHNPIPWGLYVNNSLKDSSRLLNWILNPDKKNYAISNKIKRFVRKKIQLLTVLSGISMVVLLLSIILIRTINKGKKAKDPLAFSAFQIPFYQISKNYLPTDDLGLYRQFWSEMSEITSPISDEFMLYPQSLKDDIVEKFKTEKPNRFFQLLIDYIDDNGKAVYFDLVIEIQHHKRIPTDEYTQYTFLVNLHYIKEKNGIKLLEKIVNFRREPYSSKDINLELLKLRISADILDYLIREKKMVLEQSKEIALAKKLGELLHEKFTIMNLNKEIKQLQPIIEDRNLSMNLVTDYLSNKSPVRDNQEEQAENLKKELKLGINTIEKVIK